MSTKLGKDYKFGKLIWLCGSSENQVLPPNFIKLAKDVYMPDFIAASDCMLGTVKEKEALNILLEFISGGSISSLLGKFGSFPEAKRIDGLVEAFSQQTPLMLYATPTVLDTSKKNVGARKKLLFKEKATGGGSFGCS
ncbi:hypothetical protein AgCh_000854 [Apium graveolens]